MKPDNTSNIEDDILSLDPTTPDVTIANAIRAAPYCSTMAISSFYNYTFAVTVIIYLLLKALSVSIEQVRPLVGYASIMKMRGWTETERN